MMSLPRPNRRVGWCVAFVALLGACGCATTGNPELLEARLRQREQESRMLREELAEMQSELELARGANPPVPLADNEPSDANDLGAAQRVGKIPAPTDQAGVIQAVRISPMYTGGLDRDGKPGEEILSVGFSPLSDGKAKRAEGEIDVAIYDLSRPDGEQKLASWHFDRAQAAKNWQGGFLGSQFLLQLPWAPPAGTNELTLQVTFRTPQGNVFRDSHIIGVDAPETDLVPPPAPPALLTEPETTPAPVPAVPEAPKEDFSMPNLVAPFGNKLIETQHEKPRPLPPAPPSEFSDPVVIEPPTLEPAPKKTPKPPAPKKPVIQPASKTVPDEDFKIKIVPGK